MKKLLFLFLMIIIGSCSKDDDGGLSKTRLTINTIDEVGKPVGFAFVNLYLSESDWFNDINVTNTGLTGADGVAIFDDVLLKEYFISVSDGCLSNSLSVIKTYTLQSGIDNIAVTTLKTVSSLVLTNNSSNPYSVEITGLKKFIMNGGTKLELNKKIPIGTVNIKVIQQSGYILFPTERNFSKFLTCGNTINIEFP